MENIDIECAFKFLPVGVRRYSKLFQNSVFLMTVVISHDRWFLDRVCTHILAFEGDSQVYFFEGGFTEYEENKKKRLGSDLLPKRIKYKKLVR